MLPYLSTILLQVHLLLTIHLLGNTGRHSRSKCPIMHLTSFLSLLLLGASLALGQRGGRGGGAGSSGSRSGSASGAGSATGDPAGDPNSSTPDDTPPDTSSDPSSGCTGADCQTPGISDQPPTEGIGQEIQQFLNAVTSVISTSNVGSTTITAVATLPTAASARLIIQSLYASCSSSTLNFGGEAQSVQASYLCYAPSGANHTSSWAPGPIDGFTSSCDSYVKVQTHFVGAVGLCTSAGDVRTSSGIGAAMTSTYGASASVMTAPGFSTGVPTLATVSMASRMGSGWMSIVLLAAVFGGTVA